MASAIARQMQRHRKALDAQAAPALREMSRRYDKIITATERRARALARQLETMREAGQAAQITKGQLYRMERYTILLADLRAQADTYATDVAAPQIADLQSESAWLAQEHADRTERVILGNDRALEFQERFVLVPRDAIESFSGTMGDGGQLSTYLQQTLPSETVTQVGNKIAEGLGAGLNPREVGRAAAKASGIGLQRATLIARTEMIRSYRESQRQRWANSGVVQRYRRTAAVNSRTCLGCIAMDGTIFEMRQELDDHPGGRCNLVPIFVADGEVIMPPMQNARTWLAEQPKSTQLEVMGPTRHAAWKRGDVQLTEMAQYRPNERFGGAWVPRNVSDIERGGNAGQKAAQIHERSERIIA